MLAPVVVQAALGPSATAGTREDVAAFGPVVILAVGWNRVPDAVAGLSALAGKIVVDTTNNRTGPRPEDLVDLGRFGQQREARRQQADDRQDREPAPVAAGRPVDEYLEAKLDQVLEKVSQHGQQSLTAEEREILFRASEIYRRRRK